MKKLILFFYLLFFISHVTGQNNDSTEICIIGNPHNNTSYFNAQILDSILNRIKPDLILVELDSSFFNSEFQYDTVKIPYLLKEEKSSPTIIASNNYRENHNNIDIRPFDILGRNDFYKKHDFFNRKNQMYRDIFNYASQHSFSDRNFRDFVLLSISLDYVNSFNISSLKELNSEALIKLVQLQQTIYLYKAIDIVETTDSLKRHIEFAHLQKGFWDKRNTRMILNIIYFTNKYKRIVVLTGNLHKYYLINGLKRANGNYKLKEFWTY
ncbi:MAG: hypothetical protein KAT48_08625 [Bacteroidales bacterium]|nr:hypothetical protein [Bacteroidales bacterium]